MSQTQIQGGMNAVFCVPGKVRAVLLLIASFPLISSQIAARFPGPVKRR